MYLCRPLVIDPAEFPLMIEPPGPDWQKQRNEQGVQIVKELCAPVRKSTYEHAGRAYHERLLGMSLEEVCLCFSRRAHSRTPAHAHTAARTHV